MLTKKLAFLTFFGQINNLFKQFIKMSEMAFLYSFICGIDKNIITFCNVKTYLFRQDEFQKKVKEVIYKAMEGTTSIVGTRV